MAEGFITRRGGVAAIERTASPSINFVSKTESQIVVTFTNAEANEVDIFYGITSTLTDKVTVAASGTSSNVTFSGLDPNTPYTVSAYAIVTDATLKKIKSEVVSTNITTDDVQFIEATGGTTLTYEDNGTFYKSHTFTTSGNFVVNSLSNQAALNELDYLIIAGGGGGGTMWSGGGGAGGYRTTNGTSGGNSTAENTITATAQSYGVTIGAGASQATTTVGSVVYSAGNNGSNSSALGITSIGGGGGGSGISGNVLDGKDGGSGGGRGNVNHSTTFGEGTNGQGFDGGSSGETNWNGNGPGGGGGGAGQLGFSGDLSTSDACKGGDGLANTLRNGTSEIRGGGGGGAHASGSDETLYASRGAGAGGSGGGGRGGNRSISPQSENGQINTGGGGGGQDTRFGSATTGGSGIVIIRYEVGAL